MSKIEVEEDRQENGRVLANIDASDDHRPIILILSSGTPANARRNQEREGGKLRILDVHVPFTQCLHWIIVCGVIECSPSVPLDGIVHAQGSYQQAKDG